MFYFKHRPYEKIQNELYERTGVNNPSGRFLEEPNPIENGEIAGEIVEEEGEEEVVGGQFHDTLDQLYKKNPNVWNLQIVHITFDRLPLKTSSFICQIYAWFK